MIPQRWQALVQLIGSRFREFFREPEVIFWVYGFPLVLALGLGFAFRGTAPKPPQVDVVDAPDKALADSIARKLSDESLGDEKVTVEVLPESECKTRLRQGKTSLYLIVHPKNIEYFYDETIPDNVQARYWVEAILSRGENGGSLRPDKRAITEPGRRYIDFLLPGLIGANIMGGGLFGVGFVLVDMRVRKLFKRLMATPMRHGDFLLSLLISRLLFLLPEMICLLGIGWFALGVPIAGPVNVPSVGSVVTLLTVIFVGAAAFSGVGLVLGSRTDKTETASGLINLVMMPSYILCGVFFSAKRFPDEMQPFLQALPLSQLNDALREVMLEGKDFLQVSWRIGILLAYAVGTFTLALRWFKWR